MVAKLKSTLFTAARVMSLLAVSLPAWSQERPADPFQAEELQAITAPSADIALSFVVPGRITEVFVKEGDVVPQGHVMARLDDQPERFQAQQFKVQAGDKTKILSAQAELAQKKMDLKKLEAAKAKGAASSWEVEHLMLSVRIAELALKAALLEQEQHELRYSQAVSHLDRMRLLAPIAGRVEKVAVESGESVNAVGAVIQLVKTDPLWIDVPVPLAKGKKLAAGQEVRVIFPGAEAGEAAKGKIIRVATVADAASDTLNVRIEVANPQKRPAGERVGVAFQPNGNGHQQARLGMK